MFWTLLGGTLNAQQTTSSSSFSVGRIALYVAAGIVALGLANWIAGALSDWFSWPLIIIGAIALVAGMAIDNKHVKLAAVGMIMVGTGLLMVGWTTGLLLRLVRIVAVGWDVTGTVRAPYCPQLNVFCP
jgi:hypothetical protein